MDDRSDSGDSTDDGGGDGTAGGPGLLLGLAPWIVYWILEGNVSTRSAVLIPLIVAAAVLVHQLIEGGRPKLLDVGSVVAFAVLTVIALVGDDDWLVRWIQPLANSFLFLIALVSVLVGHPFTLAYAREGVDPEVAASDRFLRVNVVITWVWVTAFAVMTVATLIPPLTDSDATIQSSDTFNDVFYWVIPILALVGAIWFTRWYAARARAAGSVRRLAGEASPG